MRFTFVHTADWQLGKRFGGFSAEKAPVLRAQRLDAVDRLAQAGMKVGATAVLVAGDIFDSETVSHSLIAGLLARLQGYPSLSWHLLPGNHDPARAGGVWEMVCASKLPANVHVHIEPRTGEIASGVVVLPAPLASKHTHHDPTAWMDGAETPAGSLRIGLAHGSARGFGTAQEANVPIDPARVRSAGLAYLALGDWHGTTRISERVWYSGTPEPDGFRDNDPGNALIVRIDGAIAPPQVERVPTAHFTWSQRAQTVDGDRALQDLGTKLDALGSSASRHLLSLKLDGAVALAEFAAIEQRLAKLSPRLFHLESDLAGLKTFAAESDLSAMSSDALAGVAQKLKSTADKGGEDGAQAQRALRKLFSLARRVEAGGLQ
jgi:hypothetical protein